MNKSLKLLSRLSCGLAAGWLTCSTTLATAEPKPSPSAAAPSAPPAIKYPIYSFFQGLTFSPFPGTIPRSAAGGNTPIFPLVEVPTPGLISAKGSGTAPVIKKKKKPVISEDEQPVRRRRRGTPKNN